MWRAFKRVREWLGAVTRRREDRSAPLSSGPAGDRDRPAGVSPADGGQVRQPGAASFAPEWMEILSRDVEFYPLLPFEHQERLRERIARFIAQKQWWGAEGLTVTDEMRVIVAAYACLLVLGSPELGLYPRTREVILFPREFGERVEAIAPDGTRYAVEDLLLGETHYRGPVLLAWNSIKPPPKRGRPVNIAAPSPGSAPGRPIDDSPRGSPVHGDVILHEFAHALDSLDGLWDGTPPLGSSVKIREWARILEEEHQALVRAAERGRRTFLDPYGAEAPTEFFAVATEAFFLEARKLRQLHPRLYDTLAAFYRQDPAAWTAPKGAPAAATE